MYPKRATNSSGVLFFGEIVKTEHSDGWSESNQYDGYGNVVESRLPEGKWSFRYDKIDRITEVSSPYASDAETYEYDDLGNRKTVTFGSFPMPTAGREYEYDALNRLTQVKQGDEKTAYSYYPNGLRAAKSNESQTTQYVYLNGQVVEELDGSGRIQAQNVFGNALILRKDNQTHQSGYYLTNSHGDVTKLVDANSGYVLNSYEYDIWGNPRQDALVQEEMSNPFRYAGEVFDSESGMIYLRARYYDPSVGRFISEDTYKGQVDNPLSLNRYVYTANNPLRFIDASGNQYTEIGDRNNWWDDLVGGWEYREQIGRALQERAKANDPNIFPPTNKEVQDARTAMLLMVSAFADNGPGGREGNYKIPTKVPLRYKLKAQDVDWRGSNKTWRDAVNEAFTKTGVDKSEFVATKWAKDSQGKSFPVEWRSKNGAEVSIDYAHYGIDRNGNWVSGPDAPHVGWQTAGKKITVGHIIIDSVPFGRPSKK